VGINATLRVGQKLRIIENRMPRKMFGAERDDVTVGWRKLHN
jgi:hypothetical protein